MDYRPTGVCSQLIHVELDGTTIKNVELEGITCGSKATSCPDQLAHALRQALNEN